MSKQLVVKPEKCVGCRTCELACSFSHTNLFNPTLSNVTVFEYEEEVVSVPVMCLQCDEAPCLKVCPVGAISRDEDGVVRVDDAKCIVCKMCTNACPLGNINYSPIRRKVFKCDLCDGEPKCVEFCPWGAIQYVDPLEETDRKKVIAETFKDAFGEGAQS